MKTVISKVGVIFREGGNLRHQFNTRLSLTRVAVLHVGPLSQVGTVSQLLRIAVAYYQLVMWLSNAMTRPRRGPVACRRSSRWRRREWTIDSHHPCRPFKLLPLDLIEIKGQNRRVSPNYLLSELVRLVEESGSGKSQEKIV